MSLASPPPGLPTGVPLFAVDVGADGTKFVPISVIQPSGSGGAVSILSTLTQPESEGSVSFLEPSVNSLQNATLPDSVQYNGLHTISTIFAFDPDGAPTALHRTTGGHTDNGSALDATALVGQDVRALLFGYNVGADTWEVLQQSGGALKTLAGSPASLVSVADATAGAKASILASNANRVLAIIQNVGSTTDAIRVGDTNISSARGILLNAGESVTLATQAEIFAVAVTGTPGISINYTE